MTFLLIIIILVIIFMYNSLVDKRAACDNAYSDIQALQQSRFDKIPDLIKYVERYMKHESSVLSRVTGLRAKAIDENAPSEKMVALDNEFSRAMESIWVSFEDYPDLKANENVLSLQQSENEIEDQIAAAGRAFNAAVAEYNGMVQMFPSNIIASIFSFKTRTFLEVPKHKLENPETIWSEIKYEQ